MKKNLYLLLAILINQNIIAQQNCRSCCNNVACGRRVGCCKTPLYGKAFFQQRSQNTNTARRAVGHHNFKHKFDIDKFNGLFSVTPEYSQSFKPYRMAQYFFGDNCINFTGSMVTQRSDNDFLADYFGLSPEFEGTITLKPKVKTFLLDFDLYFNLYKGLYLQLYTPLVHTNWGIRLCENIENRGLDVPFPAGYMDDDIVNPAAGSVTKALQGGLTFGDVSTGMKYGKFCCEKSTTKLADFTFALGYIFLNRENGYVGVNAFATAPTGTRPKSVYLFEPIAGNGRHWEFGIGFTGQVLIWEKDDEQTLHFHFDSNFSHLFWANQCRSFDFRCGPALPTNCFTRDRFASRYMLLKEFDTNGAYTGTLVPAINVTTLRCRVKSNFQMDLNIMFAYNNKNWEFDFGYNAWLRSHEKICLCESIPENKYGFKGIQNVSNLDSEITQCSATIYGNSFQDQEQVADDLFPQFITTSDLDLCSASTPLSLTHKLYWHLSYAFNKEERRATPYLGIGSHIEFESVEPRYLDLEKNTLNQWALWLKFGFNYH